MYLWAIMKLIEKRYNREIPRKSHFADTKNVKEVSNVQYMNHNNNFFEIKCDFQGKLPMNKDYFAGIGSLGDIY